MTFCIGFKPVSRIDARVLILGTLPGVKSLEHQEYYAKKQNSFWKIIHELVGSSPVLPYKDRLESLMRNKIALWDVCAAAIREGSLDSNIQSPVPNDFASFFRKHKSVEQICFNGQPASRLFGRYAVPSLPERVLFLPRMILPSTSPAYARMRYEEKLLYWRKALKPFIV